MNIIKVKNKDIDYIDEQKIKEWYDLYNEQYFDGKLTNSPNIQIVSKDTKYCGQCTYAKSLIEMNSFHLDDKYIIFIQNILIHEMIHMMQGNLGYAKGHGKSFLDKAKEINNNGWNIKVHTNVNELRFIERIENGEKLEECISIMSKANTDYIIRLLKEIYEYKNMEYNENDLRKRIIGSNRSLTKVNDLLDTIERDDNIDNSEWEKFIQWKNDCALWKVDKEGDKTLLIECQQNIEGFIENYPKYKGKIYQNKIRGYAEFDGKQITDAEIYMIMNDLNKYMLPTYSSPRGVKNAIDSVAYKNEVNIVKDWMEDNYKNFYDSEHDYIDILLRDIFRCEDLSRFYDLYYAEIKLHLMASLKKLCYAKKEADFKYDNILVLCSTQGGTGKTSFPEFLYTFNDICYTNIFDPESVNFNNKDFIEQLHDSACNVFDEVSVKRNIFNAVKSFISKKNDKFRKSYGYVANNNLRKFVLWGTSNNDDFLKDYTAGLERRWMIIHVSEDPENGVYLKEKVQKNNYEFIRHLWAQIMQLYLDDKEFEMYLNHSWDDILYKLQREYKASNNVDYNTIIDDFLEREYGYYSVEDKIYIDTDYVVEQYTHGNSKDWCKRHNEQIEMKLKRSKEDKYILQPSDKLITHYGKINKISKKQFFDILDKLGFDYTKTTLNAEMKVSKKWNGFDRKHAMCRINGNIINAYWRIDQCDIQVFNSQTVMFDDLPF